MWSIKRAQLPLLALSFVSSLFAADSAQSALNPGSSPSPASIYIWADKYVYQPGQQLTLRWTVATNGDNEAYTLFAFRTNNQTGVRTYLPGGNATPTDIFGNPAGSYRPTRLTNASKAVLIGQGGLFPAAAGVIPQEYGMHTLAVQVRDYSGTQVIRTSYFKIGVVESVETLSANIDASRTLTNNKAYNLSGVVQVRNNATLTIEPGTFIIGQPGSQPPSMLLITNTGRIVAEGTRTRPIIMTSSVAFGSRRPGDWGGLVMLGKAPVNWPNGTGNIEGLPPGDETTYGGTNADHDCGSLKYVRIEYSGAELRPNDEINTFTWGGCGKATKSDFLQSHYGLDDAFEWFGGNNDAKHLVSSYPADDHIDWQIGYTGRIQYALAIANDDGSNRGIEADNNERDFVANPLSKPAIYNVTMVGGNTRDEGASVAGIWLRRGTGADLNNFIITNWYSTGFETRDDATFAKMDTGDLKANGILLWNNGRNASKPNTLEGQVGASSLPFANGTRGQGRQFVVADPALRRPLDRSNPDFRPLPGSPVFGLNWVLPPDNGFFDPSAQFIGAFGNEDWTEEWTNFLQEQDIQVQ
jgi:hypothetical protein